MQSFAIRAMAAGGFRLTLDLSSWGALGVSLAPATIRLQARDSFAAWTDPVALEFATGAANPVTFDPLTGITVFAAPATATAGLVGVYKIAARAEFATFELPLFAGSITFIAGVSNSNGLTMGLPSADTAWVAAHPFGAAPVPAPISAAVTAAQEAARTAILRSLVFG